MTDWRPGMACLVDGEWPARIAARPTRSFVPVDYLGGEPPEFPADPNVALGRLVRPAGGALVDRLEHPRKRRVRLAQAWTGPQLRRLRDLWPFSPADQVARELGRQFKVERTGYACKIAMQRWWGRSDRRNDRVLTMRRVCHLLGELDHHTFGKLVADGLLHAERSPLRAGGTFRWAIRADELRRFVFSHPEHYDPRRMPASPYRTLGEQVHAEDPILTVREAAKATGWHHHTLTRVIREGRLRATWCAVGIGTANGRWLIRRSALADLVDLRGPTARRKWLAVERFLSERGLTSVAQRAAELGVYRGTLDRWIRDEGYPAVRIRVGGRVVYGVKPIPTFRASTAAAASEAAA